LIWPPVEPGQPAGDARGSHVLAAGASDGARLTWMSVHRSAISSIARREAAGCGDPLSISAGVGFIALSGVAVLNGCRRSTCYSGVTAQTKRLRWRLIWLTPGSA